MENENIETNNQSNITGSDDLCSLSNACNRELANLIENIKKETKNCSFLETGELWAGTESKKYKVRYFDLKSNIDKVILNLEKLEKSLLIIATELNYANQSSLDAESLKLTQDKALNKFFKSSGLLGNLGGVFNSPLDEGLGLHLTTDFGMRWGKRHNAIDITPVGGNGLANINSISDGTIISVKTGYNGGWGNQVIVRSTDPFTNETIDVTYSHMSKNSITVKEGDTVTAGTKVGIMGTTGFSTGVHLDLSMKNSDGQYIDPIPYLINVERKNEPFTTRRGEFEGKTINSDGIIE